MIELLNEFNWIGEEINLQKKSITLSRNKSKRFESRFSTLQVNNTDNIFLRKLEGTNFGMWVSHAEGNFEIDDNHNQE